MNVAVRSESSQENRQPCHPHLDHGYDVTWIQQVNHSLGREFEADLHSESHAQGNQQQVLAQTVLLRLRAVF